MPQAVLIGIIGDFNPDSPSHRATNEALGHRADVYLEAVRWRTASVGS